MLYNAVGQRVQKENNAETKKFLYDQNRLLQETDGSDSTTREYTFSTQSEYGDLISEFGNSTNSYHTYAAQWSTAELIDDSLLFG